MEQMKELYQKVAGDADLQSKFAEIIKNAQEAEPKETANKLVVFAKDAGYDISIEEMQQFYNEMEERPDGELDENELDQVAGGKTTKEWKFAISLTTAVVSIGAIQIKPIADTCITVSNNFFEPI